MLRTSLKVWLSLALSTVALFALWWFFEGRHEGLQVIVDGDGLSVIGDDNPLWAIGGLVMGGLFFAVVVPLVLLLAVGVPALVLCGVVAIVLVVAGVVMGTMLAPLALPVLLVWWLLRRDRRTPQPAPPAASTTIAP
jgi:hypothetical protein